MSRGDTRASYDRVAREYAARIYGELSGKPLDRELLDTLARETSGIIADLGCGPGHVARYLKDQGAQVCGVDLSPGMVAEARRLNPDIPFIVGDLAALPVADGAWGGVAAFYSLIRLSRAELPRAAREIKRALRPGGMVLLAFHRGTETVHLDDWWGEAVSVDFNFFQTAEVVEALAASGFLIEHIWEREPYPDVEHPSRRAYVLARKP